MKRFIIFTSFAIFLTSSSMAFAGEVFITKNGKKYHQQTCPLIKNKGAQPIDEKIAVEQGLQPCSKCFKEKLPNQSDQNNTGGNLIKSDKKNKK